MLLGLLLCTAAGGCAWLRPEDAAEMESRGLAEQARQAADEGDLPRARELLARAVQANPEDADLHRQRARLMLNEGQCRAAVEHLEYALSQAPGDASVLVELAHAQAAEHDWLAARRSVYAALEHDPQHVPALLLAAGLADRAGDDSEALALYHRALKSDPHNPTARLGIAGVHVRGDRPARAAPLLRSVGQDVHVCEADRARAFRELGHVFALQERWAATAEAFDSVVRLESQATPHDWCRLAEARRRMGDPAGARQAVTHALALAPEHAAALELAAAVGYHDDAPLRPVVQAGHTTER